MAISLALEGASFSYGKLVVIHPTDLELSPGGSLIVTGSNGSGKSTFLYLCAGVLKATSGDVLLNGISPTSVRPSTLFRQGVRRGVVFDSDGLLSNLSALGNVMLPLEYHADILSLSPEDIEWRAREALGRVGVLQTDLHALPAHLSLGTRKCVGLARAIAIGPNFLFLDDPDAGLDAPSTKLVHRVIDDFLNDREVTLVVASNSRLLVERFSKNAYEIVNGHLFQGQLR